MINDIPPLQTNRLILCEGPEDCAFIRALIHEKGLGGFDVRAVQDIGDGPGIDGFKSALIGAVSLTGFPERIEKVVLVADSDTHYRANFDKLCDQIKAANADTTVGHRFQAPTEQRRLSGGHPRIAIILHPALNSTGCLETLLLKGMATMPQYSRALSSSEAAQKSVGIEGKWSASKLDKSRVRIVLALHYEKNPALALGKLWGQAEQLIPPSMPEFNDFADALSAI